MNTATIPPPNEMLTCMVCGKDTHIWANALLPIDIEFISGDYHAMNTIGYQFPIRACIRCLHSIDPTEKAHGSFMLLGEDRRRDD